MAKFRLLRGEHVNMKTMKTYLPGAIIESDQDLTRGGKDRQKYELIPSVEPMDETNALEKMTVPALKKLAEEEGIDLGDAVLKDEIVETIKLACV